MEDKLRALVAKIEESKKLSDPVKDKLYETIQMGLQSLVWPILLDYLPSDKVKHYTEHPDELTTEVYIALIQEALSVRDGEALQKLEDATNKLLSDLDAALIKEV